MSKAPLTRWEEEAIEQLNKPLALLNELPWRTPLPTHTWKPLTIFSNAPFRAPAQETDIMNYRPNQNLNARNHAAGTKAFFVIWNMTSDRPITQTFNTADHAWQIADEMSKKFIGQRFFVLGSVGSSCAETPVVRRSAQAIVAKKTVAKKTVAKKTAAKKTVAKKTVAKKTVAKKTVAKKTNR